MATEQEDRYTAYEVWQKMKQPETWASIGQGRQESLGKFVGLVRDLGGRKEYAVLRKAAFAVYDETPNRSSMEWLGEKGGRRYPQVHVLISHSLADGSQIKRLVRAQFDTRSQETTPAEDRPVEISVLGEWQDSNDWFWNKYREPNENAVVTRDFVHYMIGKQGRDGDVMSGFNGARWTVFFNDGRIVHTNNLWYQGKIPTVHREAIPANAVLVQGTLTERPKEN